MSNITVIVQFCKILCTNDITGEQHQKKLKIKNRFFLFSGASVRGDFLAFTVSRMSTSVPRVLATTAAFVRIL